MVGGPVSRALRTANPTLARQLTLEGRIEISLSLSLSLVERDNIARHWSAQRVAQPAAVSTLRESQYPSIRFRNIRMMIVEASKIRSNFSHRRICVFRLFVPPPFNSPCRGSKPIPPLSFPSSYPRSPLYPHRFLHLSAAYFLPISPRSESRLSYL